jgi:hypothetical protein
MGLQKGGGSPGAGNPGRWPNQAPRRRKGKKKGDKKKGGERRRKGEKGGRKGT